MRKVGPLGLLAAVLLCVGIPSAVLADRCEPWAARLVSSQGLVEFKPIGDANWRPAPFGEPFCFGDTLRVGPRSRASVELQNDTIVRLEEQSVLLLPEPDAEGRGFLDLVEGALHLISRVRRALEVRTPFVNAGLEGTEFVVRVAPDTGTVVVVEGRVLVSNAFGRILLSGGQAASASRGQAPVLRLDIDPVDAVDWAIHYPAIHAEAASPALVEAEANLRVGRVDEARAQIAGSLAANPDDPVALALGAIVELAQNRHDTALRMAESAVASSATPSTLTALSYAQQAGFDIGAARRTLERAVAAYPAQALLWARLAELQTAEGDREAALDSARRAVALDASLSRTHTVLGFASLEATDITTAGDAFRRAIELDSADPLPRLGLGIALLGDGDAAGGRRQLEIAASLDPTNAMVRSYLGKAYLGEDRYANAATELALAKQLDPQDPTPWLYGAVLDSARGREVAAFQELQGSIERNDNRAVFRSRFQLDQDLAIRSAALGRVYGSIGFDRRGLLEGWLATTDEPASFAAHQLLADTYASLPRHEIAELSERLQAQLLSPGGLSAEPPQVSQNRLGIDGAIYRDALSQRELGALYDEGGGQFLGSLLVGGNGTTALDVAAAMNHDRFAMSFGHFSYETDGFGVNDAQEQDITNLVLKGNLTPDTSLLFEVRDREREAGLGERFFDEANDGLVEFRERRQYRLGGRHAFDARNVLIAAHTRLDEDYSVTLREFPFFGLFDATADVDESATDLRYLWQTRFGHIDLGVSHAETENTSRTVYLDFDTFLTVIEDEQTDVSHTTAYAYANLSVTDSLNLVLGLSADDLDIDIRADSPRRFTRSALNPKLGLVWRIDDAWIARAAFMQSGSRVIDDAQTLEPTHVAGFNQFFDDPAGTLSRDTGIAIDYRPDADWFGGIELGRRELDIPVDDGAGIDEIETSEDRGRIHLGHVFSPRLTGSLAFHYEHIDRDDGAGPQIDGYAWSTVQRMPATLHFFPRDDVKAMLRASYVKQYGRFARPAATGGFDKGSDRFWVVDAALTKRLPGNRAAITVGVENLMDESFAFQDTDSQRSTIARGRRGFVQLNVSF
jgi:Flp pilus assembly protein TadD